jgi:replication fork protection complex subunit Csm3/Swi3
MMVDDDEEEEEESFWKELEAVKTLQPAQRNQQHSKSHRAPGQSVDNINEAEMWATLDEVPNHSSAAFGETVPRNSRADSEKVDEMDIDDDDMWDIIKENEKTTPARHSPTKNSTAVTTYSADKSAQQPSASDRPLAESEMDWDDMYAD